MFKKNSTVKLLGLLGGLVVAFLVIKYTKNTSRSSSLRSELVTIDQEKVTKLIVTKGESETALDKEGEHWLLTLSNGRKVKAKSGSVGNALSSLKGVKPSRLVSKSEAKWKDYQVDSAGYQVQVFEGGKKTLDMIIGRLGVENQRAFHTFVRLTEDKETYRANDFMAFSVPSESSGYRDGLMLSLKKDSLQKVMINYAENALVLEKGGGLWTVNGEPADSASVAAYLSGISYGSSTKFIDDIDNYQLPSYSATFVQQNGLETKVDAFVDGQNYVLKSSSNVQEMVNDSTLHNKIFKSKKDFL